MTGFALAGLGFGWAMTGLSTVVQERAPEELRGRIMALWLVGFLGSRPIAAALLGGTADLVSVQAAFAVAAALTLAVDAVVPAVEPRRPAADTRMTRVPGATEAQRRWRRGPGRASRRTARRRS